MPTKKVHARSSSKPATASTKLAYWAEGQVANRLGVSVQWLRKQRAMGTGIPFHKFGRSIRYRIDDVLSYEDSTTQSFTGQSQPPSISDTRFSSMY